MAKPLDRITRSSLRAYGGNVTDLLMELVNHLGVRYRFVGNGGAILLYGPDEEAQPFRVSPNRSDSNTEKFLLDWAAKELRGNTTEVQAKRLAAVLNDPIEHPAKVGPSQQEVVKETAAQAEALKPERGEPVEIKPSQPTMVRTAEPPRPDEPEDAKAEVLYPYEDRSLWAPITEGWTQHRASKDRVVNWETKDGVFRCLVCKKMGEDYRTTDKFAVGGHNRAKHRDAGMWSTEARAKVNEKKRVNRHMRENVLTAVEALMKAIDAPLPVNDELQEQVEQLKRDLGLALAERDMAIKDRDEVAARLALIQEALGA